MGISLPENEPKKDNHDHHHDDISNTLAKLSLNKTEPDLLDVVEKSLAKISLVISEEEEEEEEKGDKEEEEEEEEITKDDVAERRKEGNDDDVEDDKKIIDNVGLREEKTEEEEDDGVKEETEEKEKGEEEEEEEEVKDVTEKYKKLTVKKDIDDDDDKEEEEKEEEEEEEKEEKKEEEEEGTKVTPIKNLGQKVNRDLVMDGVRRVSKDNDSTHTHRDTASPPGSPNTSTEDQGEEKPKLRSRGLMGLASVPLGSYELQNSVESVSVDSPSSSYSMSPAYHYDNVGINEQFQYQQSPGFHLPISPAPSSIDDGENWLQNCRLNGQQLQQQQQQQYYNNNNQYIYNDHLQYNQQQQQQQLHGFLGDNNNMQFTDNNNIQFGQNVCSQIQQQQQQQQQPSQLLYDHQRALPQQQQQHLQQQHQYQQQRQQQQQPQVPDECAPLQFEDSPSPLMFPDGSYSPPSSQQQQYHHQLGFQGGQLSYEPVPEVPLRGEDKLDITLVIDAFKKEILTPNTEPISKSAIAPIKQQLLESINELQPYLEAPTQQPQLQPQYPPYYQHQQLQQQHCNNLTTSTTTSSPPPPPLCDQSQLQAISSNSNLPDRNWRMVRDNNLVLKYHKEFAMRKNEHVVEMDTDGDTPTMILACHPVKKPEYAEALQAIVLRQKNVDLHCNLPVIEAVNGGKVCRKCGTSDHNAFYSSLSLKNKQGYSVLTSVIALRHPVDVIRFLLGSLRPSDLPRIFTNNDHIFTWAVELYPELQPFVTRYC